MKLYKDIRLILATAAVGLVFGSCSNDQVDDFFKKIIQAPPSSIERDVKGHEQIYAVHAILRMGYKGGMIGVGPERKRTLFKPITPIISSVARLYPSHAG